MPRLINLKKNKPPVIQENNQDHQPGESDELKRNMELLLRLDNKINYSIKETAKIIGRSYEFTRKARKAGKIKSVSYGDTHMINVTELARILTEGI